MRRTVFLIACLLVIVASCSKKTTATRTKETPKEPPIDAALVFSNNCARCHGSDGTNGKAPNLSKTEFDKTEIIQQVIRGDGRMPEFEDKLSQKEIVAVADFVVSLKK